MAHASKGALLNIHYYYYYYYYLVMIDSSSNQMLYFIHSFIHSYSFIQTNGLFWRVVSITTVEISRGIIKSPFINKMNKLMLFIILQVFE